MSEDDDPRTLYEAYVDKAHAYLNRVAVPPGSPMGVRPVWDHHGQPVSYDIVTGHKRLEMFTGQGLDPLLNIKCLGYEIGLRRQVFNFGNAPYFITENYAESFMLCGGEAQHQNVVRAEPKLLSPVTILSCMEDAAFFMKDVMRGRPQTPTRIRVDTPNLWARRLLERDTALFPLLKGVVDYPVFFHRELLSGDMGYHPDTALLINSRRIQKESFDGPGDALDWLVNAWLEPFSFQTRDDALRALLLCMSLMTRKTMNFGGCPAFMITSPDPNSGKTWLAKVLTAAVTSHSATPINFSTRQDEFDKMLLAELQTSPPILLLDDVPDGHKLKMPSVNRYTTADVMTGRLLGENRMVSLPTNPLMVFTGNNLSAEDALASRLIEIRLERGARKKEELEHMMTKTLELQPKILHALATILSTKPTATSGRFKKWAYVVGGRLAAAAQHASFLQTWSDMDAGGVSSNDESFVAFLMRLEELLARPQAPRVSDAKDDLNGKRVATTAYMVDHMKDELFELLHLPKSEDVSLISVGKRLSRHRDRLANGQRLRMRKARVEGQRAPVLGLWIEGKSDAPVDGGEPLPEMPF